MELQTRELTKELIKIKGQKSNRLVLYRGTAMKPAGLGKAYFGLLATHPDPRFRLEIKRIVSKKEEHWQ